jgi:hypothetical protein
MCQCPATGCGHTIEPQLAEDVTDARWTAEPMTLDLVQAGLCDACAHARLVTSGRGSEFLLCERSRTDARYPRYPRLPVVVCAGYELRERRPPAEIAPTATDIDSDG